MEREKPRARPAEGKKGADKGIDARICFHEGDSAQRKQVILSVKAGKLHAPYVRDLRGVVERKKAAIGMRSRSTSRRRRRERKQRRPGSTSRRGGQYQRPQIGTITELLNGNKIDIPPVHQTSVTFKRAPKAATKGSKTSSLDFGGE